MRVALFIRHRADAIGFRRAAFVATDLPQIRAK
jgi:hypothetical protein